MKYQVVLSHHNCLPPSFLMLPPALTHAKVLMHKHAHCNCFKVIAKCKEKQQRNTLCRRFILFVFVHQYQMCSKHAAGGSTLTFAHSLSSTAKHSAEIWFRPLTLPSIPPSLRTIIHDIRASRQPRTAVARAERSNTPGPPNLLHAQTATQATGILA